MPLLTVSTGSISLRWHIALALLIVGLSGEIRTVESATIKYPPVVAGHLLRFPQDQGSHPEFRTEWWYVTGHLATDAGESLGFQVTFFRNRPAVESSNPSRFNPRQLLFAHAALADISQGRLVHDERSARAGFSLAGAEEGRTKLWIGDWKLERIGHDYRISIPARDFSFEFTLTPTQPILMNGYQGYSQKGPRASEASYYYSEPQLRVSGVLERQGRRLTVMGKAWLDHEWSSALLNERAVGWDWIGINLEDGSALMAFNMRDRAGKTLWAGGTRRYEDGRTIILKPAEIAFIPRRRWISPRTGIRYPVVWEVRIPGLSLTLQPIMDDQELDTRASTGTIYWEGAVRAKSGTSLVGVGYLEMTGYGQALRF